MDSLYFDPTYTFKGGESFYEGDKKNQRNQPRNIFADGGEVNNGESGNWVRFGRNLVKNPIRALYDAALWGADRLGAPSNVTNYLRDLENNVHYRAATLPPALVKTLVDYAKTNKLSFEDAYEYYLENPTFLQRMSAMEPLNNDNSNYSAEELKVIKEMAGSKGEIRDADIRRVSGDYGGNGVSTWDYVTRPDRVVQTSIGNARGKNGMSHDVFDVNTKHSSRKDFLNNQKYFEKARNNPGVNYHTIRAVMPFTNSTDYMPDKYKIHTNINLKDIR